MGEQGSAAQGSDPQRVYGAALALWLLLALALLAFALWQPQQVLNSTELASAYSDEALAFLAPSPASIQRGFQRAAVLATLRLSPLLLPFFLLGAWAHLDAERRARPKWLVPLIVVFSFPIGWLIWLLGRPKVPRPEKQ